MIDKQQTIEILEALANGVDPVSGEVFPADSPYQQPDVIRALFYALDALKGSKTAKSKEGRQGEPWTEEEQQELTEGFQNDMTISELAKTHQRTSGAIRSRLRKLGLIEE